MKKLLFDYGTRDASSSYGIFALRVMTGLMMLIGHGIPKIRGYAALKDTFYVANLFPLNHLSPPLSLMACIGAEVGAAILIILGLTTRPAAFVLAFSMVVAVFGRQAGAPWFCSPPDIVNAKELGLLYLMPLVAIILTGAGAWSLDARIYRENRYRRR